MSQSSRPGHAGWCCVLISDLHLTIVLCFPDIFSQLKVHRGFNGVFSDGLYDTVPSYIRPLLERTNSANELYYNNTIHIGGHSLGGANAQSLWYILCILPPGCQDLCDKDRGITHTKS